MHRQPCAGRLAEREGRAGVVDVVVGEDDRVDIGWLEALLADEPKHRSVAARVARIDNRDVVPADVQVGLRPMDTGDPLNHLPIIRDISLPGSRGRDGSGVSRAG